jgi:hypothetical protein
MCLSVQLELYWQMSKVCVCVCVCVCACVCVCVCVCVSHSTLAHRPARSVGSNVAKIFECADGRHNHFSSPAAVPACMPASRYKVPLSVDLDPAVAAGLVDAAGGEDQNVSGILAFADSEPIALRWGEVIPLTFFKALFEGERSSKVAVLSVPTRR